MGRQQSSVLDPDLYDSNEWFFVVQWITRRFDDEELSPLTAYVMSEPVGIAIDRNVDMESAHEQVRASWRCLQKRWSEGWSLESNSKLPNAAEYFQSLVADTNAWIDQMFPSNGHGSGRERKRLLAAVRQQRLREKRKATTSRSAIQVSVSGDLYKQLWKHWQIPETKRHDVVRAALQVVLESPELLTKVKQLAGVTG